MNKEAYNNRKEYPIDSDQLAEEPGGIEGIPETV
jgi:hypothetical protein